MQPTIGQIVYYKDGEEYVYPAIVTFVNGDEMTLTVFRRAKTEEGVPTRIGAMAVGPSEAEAYQWWWPERL